MIVLEQKLCSRCKETKSIESFSKDKYHTSGYKSACKACASIDHKSWRTENLDAIREQDKINQVAKKYKISKDEAKQYCDNRVGECTICKNKLFRVVDHCHTTGDIRGFICSPCNSMLGYAKDNITTLQNAIQYLKDHYELF